MIYFVLTTVSLVGYDNPLESPYIKVLLAILVVTGIIVVPSKCA